MEVDMSSEWFYLQQWAKLRYLREKEQAEKDAQEKESTPITTPPEN